MLQLYLLPFSFYYSMQHITLIIEFNKVLSQERYLK